MWVVPKIRGTFLGAPPIRTMVFGGLYWGPLILGNYHRRAAIRFCPDFHACLQILTDAVRGAGELCTSVCFRVWRFRF